MIISIIVLIISFILQGITSTYLGYNLNNPSIFFTIYPLISLLILTPYFENKTKHIILMLIFGLLTDITYSNTFLLNTSIFLLLYYISKSFHFFFPYNLLTINISNLICITLYHMIIFTFLSILKYDIYNLKILIKIITSSILMTIIYSSIIYTILDLTFKKLQLKEIK